MPRPTDPPFDWASDATYPAGGDPWSGAPTKVDPGAGLIATGFVPGTLARAEEMNALQRRQARWAQYVEEMTDESQMVAAAAAFVPVDSNGSIVRRSAPSWDAAFVGSVWSTTSGVVALAFMDLTPRMPRVASEVRLVSMQGLQGDACQTTVSIRRRPGNAGAMSTTGAGNIIYTTAAAAPFAAFNATAAGVEWVPYEPGDRLEMDLRSDAIGGVGSLDLQSVVIAIRHV